MTVLDSLEGGPQLALKAFGDALTKELGDFVGPQEQKSRLTGTLEELADGEVALKDEVAAVLNLTDGVEPIEVHGQSFPLGEFRSEQVRPVVEPFADQLWGEALGSGLKGLGIGSGKKGVVVLTEVNPNTVKLGLNEIMAIEPIGGVKGKEGGHPHHYSSEPLVSDIEVIVGKASSVFAQDPVTGVSRGKFRLTGAKGGTVFHALKDEVEAVAVVSLHTAQERSDKLFLTNSFFSPLHGDSVVSGEGLYPLLVVLSPLSQDLFGDGRLSHDLAEEVHDVLRAR